MQGKDLAKSFFFNCVIFVLGAISCVFHFSKIFYIYILKDQNKVQLHIKILKVKKFKIEYFNLLS